MTEEVGADAAPMRQTDFAPDRTAIVIIDMINHQCAPEGGMMTAFDKASIDTSYIRDRMGSLVLPAHRDLIDAVRATGGKIVFLRGGAYDAGYADLTRAFKTSVGTYEPRADLWGTQILDEIDFRPGDVSLIKTGSGGFYTSALDSHLRNMQINTILYTGVITNGCVMLTAAGGFDRGYRGLVVSDATATLSEGLQNAAEVMIDGYIANVVKSAEVVELLQGKSTMEEWEHTWQARQNECTTPHAWLKTFG